MTKLFALATTWWAQALRPWHISAAGAACVIALVGCGTDDAAQAAITPAQVEVHSRQSVGGACDFTGTWAVKFDIPVTWSFNMGISGGSGVIEQWALVTRRMAEDGQAITEEVRPCGSSIPTYRSLAIYGGESYGVSFPDSLFDSGTLPTLMGETHLTGRAPGSSYLTAPLPITLGVNLPNAATMPWPKRTADLTPFVTDSDADGQPGVTAFAREDGDLVLPPVNTSKTHRAHRFHIALRNIIGARGHIVSCDRFEGDAVVPKISGRPAIHSTILGCELTDSSLCSRGQATLANTFQPVYQLADGSRSVMVRVADSTHCAEVRALPF